MYKATQAKIFVLGLQKIKINEEEEWILLFLDFRIGLIHRGFITVKTWSQLWLFKSAGKVSYI